MVDSPFVLGIFRPVIYLPLGLSERDREMVLSHERAHLKRRGNWVKPLAYILLAAHWFNPLVWISYVLLCRDIESACDERVLKDMGREERRAYSAALLNCSVRPRMISACPLAFGELSVKGRIKSVLNYKKPGFWISLAALAACAVVAVCFLTDPVTENENPQASPESLAAEDAGEAQPQEGQAPEETMPAMDPSLLFVIPKDGEGSDYAPESLTQIREETEELPALYLDSRAVESLERMLSDCRSAGHEVEVFRAYESYEETLKLYEEALAEGSHLTKEELWDFYRSPTKRDLQSGLSVMFSRFPDGEFYTTEEWQDQEVIEARKQEWNETVAWLNEHCAEYGFVQCFPMDKIQISGMGSSLAYRYVGESVAAYMKGSGLCLEEYLGAADTAVSAAQQDRPKAEVLGAYELSGEYLCYVNISPVEPEYLRPEYNYFSVMGERTLGENSLSYIRAATYMDGYPVTAYDEQSKTLTLCFKEFMDEMGDEWPVEVDVKMLLDGELLPGPGKLQLPEPQETESLSLSLPQPVEYSLEGMDNSLYLLGVELKPYALAGVMGWADYERFIGDVENWDDLDKAEKEWSGRMNPLFAQTAWQAMQSITVYLDDGSSIDVVTMFGPGEEEGRLLNWTYQFPQPIDFDSVAAVSVGGQTIEVNN